jgi:hypothetical protein
MLRKKNINYKCFKQKHAEKYLDMRAMQQGGVLRNKDLRDEYTPPSIVKIVK